MKTFVQFTEALLDERPTLSEAMIDVPCPRCDGSGRHSYHMTKGTVCFKCDGVGTIKMTDAAYKKLQDKRNAPLKQPDLSPIMDLAVLFGLSKPDVHYAERNPNLLNTLRLTLDDYKKYALQFQHGERKISRADFDAAHANWAKVNNHHD